MHDGDLPAPTTRARRGRWLGGVCAGLAVRWGVAPGRVRLGFVLGSLFLGLGALAYLAAWLILPAESEDGVTAGQRGIVLLAQACGSLLGLATLAGAGAIATVFGLGWVVVALAGAILVGTLAGWRRLGPAWALLPIGALVLPSAAVAMSGLYVEPSTSARTVAPRAEQDLEDYTSGLGLLTIDLRRTALPERGEIPLRINAGVRRTLVALPHDRCVHVEVTQHDMPDLLRLGAFFLGDATLANPTPVVFGDFGAVRDERGRGPTLAIDYSTMGGELVVRDYPDDVDPRERPDWPGYEVYVEERPDITGLSRAEGKRLVREWRTRRKGQQRSKERIDRLMGGPCAREAKPK